MGILRESSSQKPECIKFVVLRTRQVAEYNIKLNSKTLPIDVEMDEEVNLLRIKKVNDIKNLSLCQGIRAGDHLLRVNQVDVARLDEKTERMYGEQEIYDVI